MLKHAEDSGISRDTREGSEENKEISIRQEEWSVLGKFHMEDEANGSALSGSDSTSENTDVFELPASARPQRAKHM